MTELNYFQTFKNPFCISTSWVLPHTPWKSGKCLNSGA